MSEKVGPMTIGKDEENPFLGREIQQRDFYSEETARLVDSEIRKLIQNAHKKSIEILTEKSKVLNILAEELLDKEILNVDDIYNMILNNIPEEEKEFVNQQYEKAKEIKIDSSSHLKNPPVKEVSDNAQQKKNKNSADEKKAVKEDNSGDKEMKPETTPAKEKKQEKKEVDDRKKSKEKAEEDE
jgi:cell division protease FtsH